MNTPIVDQWHVGQAAIMEHEFFMDQYMLIKIITVTPKKVTYVRWIHRENNWGTERHLRLKCFIIHLLGSAEGIKPAKLSQIYDQMQSFTGELKKRIQKAKIYYVAKVQKLKL